MIQCHYIYALTLEWLGGIRNPTQLNANAGFALIPSAMDNVKETTKVNVKILWFLRAELFSMMHFVCVCVYNVGNPSILCTRNA